MISRRGLLLTGATGLMAKSAYAQGTSDIIRIGVLSDMSGAYADSGGPTSVACTQMAADEFMAAVPGIKVEVFHGDHLNKPDTAVAIARQWFDRDGVDVVTNCNNSAIGLAISNLAHEKNKVNLNTGAASADLTGPACTPNFVHWTYDTWELAHSTGTAAVKAGGDKWFFIAADYAFGHAMQRDLIQWVQNAGGTVLGSVFYPFPGTSDFSSLLVQAQSSGASVVALLNAGADFINCIKQAHEFGLTPPKIRLAGTATFITDIHSLGLEVAQGLTYTECFYWDMNERTRAFTRRVLKRSPKNYPNQEHAGDYAATLHYLKTVKEIGVARARASGVDTVNAMKAMPTDDDAYGPGKIRIDGRHIHPAYLLEAKTPGESHGEWDLLKLVQTTPADEAFRPLKEGHCPLVPT